MEKIKICNWEINTDYRCVLFAFDIAKDDILSLQDKINLTLKVFVKNKVRLLFLSFDKRCKLYERIFVDFVGRGQTTKSEDNSVPVFDVRHDEATIYAAFRQAYDIDLRNIKYLHWYSFLDLLLALPEDTQFKKIVGIRAAPIPKATKYNQEQINLLLKQKAAFALPYDKEKSRERLNKSIYKLAQTLKAWGQCE